MGRSFHLQSYKESQYQENSWVSQKEIPYELNLFKNVEVNQVNKDRRVFQAEKQHRQSYDSKKPRET